MTSLFFLLASLALNLGMIFIARSYIHRAIGDIPEKTAVLVLGSQTHGTTLSRVLEDRVVAGIDLALAGKGKKLLLSGDHGQRYYDEVTAMRLYVLENAPDIPEEDIFLDHAGFSTYESLYRARDVFEVEDLIVVTQEFHAARSAFLARSLRLDAVVYAQSQGKFPWKTRLAWEVREYFARIKAVFSILLKPSPTYLGDPIPISGDGRATWR